MSALESLSAEERAELDQAVYASYGRMVLGAPPPEGSVTIHAADAEDLARQIEDMISGQGHQG